MRITLITACLNAAETIERTIKSIETQNYSDLEYIICDGGSTDGTLEVIERYRHLISHVISEKDKNVADALNKGFDRATGDIFAYLNADDALAPGALDHVVAMFRDNPSADVVTGGCLRVFADGSEFTTQVPDRYLDVLALRNDIEQPSTFWKASMHRRAGHLDDSFYLAFDWELWNRLKSLGAQFVRTEKVLSVYYFSDDNLTSRAGMRVIDEMYRITKKYGPIWGYSADIYWLMFKRFDMRGYYDKPFDQLSDKRRRRFGFWLKCLTLLFGERIVNNYNWNWASKQVRGLKWY